MRLNNTSFPLESVIVAVCIVEPNQLCAFCSPSFLFPFFSFLNISPEQFSPKALDRAEKCREERETDRERRRERKKERLKNTRPSALKGNLVQSLNKDKRKLNSGPSASSILGEFGENPGREEIWCGESAHSRGGRNTYGRKKAQDGSHDGLSRVTLHTQCGASEPEDSVWMASPLWGSMTLCVQAQAEWWGHAHGSGRRPGMQNHSLQSI